MARSKRDTHQIAQFEHDEASNAKRVKIADTQIAIELDHNDGDSVTSHPPVLSVSAIGVDDADTEIIPPQDIKSLRRLLVHIEHPGAAPTGSVRVEVSPVDSGDVWDTLATINVATAGSGSIIEVLGRRVRVVKDSALTESHNIHLVGQG